jgi:UDP-N-acetylmuramoyl-L-alanyl-D-glutamate--2,6-diaminopimelate ligase
LRLTDLLSGNSTGLHGAQYDAIRITGLTADSRQVQPGFLFAALAGRRADGRLYIDEAVRRGAAAILAPAGAAPLLAAGKGAFAPVTFVFDDNPRRRFALMAARFYARQPRTVAAVTGTNGKTSVVWFLRQIWDALGHSAGSIGTLGVIAPGIGESGSLTTPDTVTLHRTLARLAEVGVDRLAIEASSHGLDQYRLDGVKITAAAFTNLTRDHLDYHGTMQAYLSAKLRLFSELVAAEGAAVICADGAHAGPVRSVAAERGLRVLTYGRRGDDLRILALEQVVDGQRLTLRIGGGNRSIDLPLVGDFQAANALAAAGLAIATGADADDVLPALAKLAPVRGRMERVARIRDFASIYVDYAHTPDALAVVLRALRPQARGKLIVVFGCGGDRDAGKRPEMGRIASALADRVIVTDDNPRSESPAEIRRQILIGCTDAEEIGDRAEAIARAIRSLRVGDVLLVAGKGHETGQIIGSRVLPFDDAEVVRAAVRELRR